MTLRDKRIRARRECGVIFYPKRLRSIFCCRRCAIIKSPAKDKMCHSCGEEKPISDFYTYSSQCIKCILKKAKAYRSKAEPKPRKEKLKLDKWPSHMDFRK